MREPFNTPATQLDSLEEAPPDLQPHAQALVGLSFEYINQIELDTASLLEGIQRLAALSLPGVVEVVVTADFEKSFELRVAKKYSACFSQTRLGGVTIAKTVTNGGSSIILVEGKALLPDVASKLSCSLSRILEHEGQHLLVRARHEDPHTTHYRGSDCETPTGWLRLLAALAIEEFRVELALTKNSNFKHEDEACIEAIESLWGKLEALHADSDSEERDGELGVCFKELAVMAAERTAGHCGGQPISQHLTANEAVSAMWARYSATLALVPPSDVAITEADLNEHVNAVSVLLEEWLGHLGFAFESGDGLAFRSLDTP
jgi:hypothetical protein